ncbi:MAG: hypothetical protein R2880_13400 [Deinococcales bacterium]
MTTTRKNQSLLAKASLAAAALTALSAQQEAQAQKPMNNFVMAPPVMLQSAVVANDVSGARAASAKLVSELSGDANALASFNANPVAFLESRGFQRDLQVELLAEFGGFVNPGPSRWLVYLHRLLRYPNQQRRSR